MEPRRNYIVFQCYGNEGIFYECVYALLSLSRLYPPGELNNTEIWIYTDNVGWFQSFRDCPLPLNYREIDGEVIKRWRGNIDFVHRVKIELLKDFIKTRKGNILYTDTDVVFTRPIDRMLEDIGAGKLYMHLMEGIVKDEGNPVLKKLDKYVGTKADNKVDGKLLRDYAMWNAGVLGFNTDVDLLDKVLAFTDKEYPQFPKHVVEQFAFSVYFQAEGEVKAAAPYILHYWNLKEARLALASFFKEFKNEGWQALTGYSALLQMPVLMQEKVNYLHNRSIMDKLLKKQWAPPKLDWVELRKQI